MNIFGWLNPALALLAASAGAVVLHGIFRAALSGRATLRFFRWSLIASIAGLMPLSRHLAPIQKISILCVYCSGAAIIAWLRFGLQGRSRGIFALCVTAVLYSDLVFVFTRLFRDAPLFTAPLRQPLPFFQFAQIVFATAFIGLGILVVRKCRTDQATASTIVRVRPT